MSLCRADEHRRNSKTEQEARIFHEKATNPANRHYNQYSRVTWIPIRDMKVPVTFSP